MKKFFFTILLLNLLSFNTVIAQDEIVDTPAEIAALQSVPKYPGGSGAFQQYVLSQVKGLDLTKPQTLYVHFVVEKDGTLSNITFSGNSNIELQKLVFKALKTCEKWTPGYLDNNAVRVKITLPIITKHKS